MKDVFSTKDFTGSINENETVQFRLQDSFFTFQKRKQKCTKLNIN